MTTPANYLRRYTNLPALLHLLREKEITLLDPKTWDDRNDSYFMSLYKERQRLKTVLALCFSRSAETYHHWRVFSNGPAGVCIVFHQDALTAALEHNTGICAAPVKYLTLERAQERQIKVKDLPFLKRYGFKPEDEFRAVYTSKKKECSYLSIPIDLKCIQRIVLSPWMSRDLFDSTKHAICQVEGCGKLTVKRSTLISNEQWKELGRNAR